MSAGAFVGALGTAVIIYLLAWRRADMAHRQSGWSHVDRRHAIGAHPAHHDSARGAAFPFDRACDLGAGLALGVRLGTALQLVQGFDAVFDPAVELKSIT
ncbi:hypothetical protein [Kibdelosporangium philippinense]|uniref:hypothetical protein n=1 Tax=Kibdelosporangium philippinense TaxID=211113 RepID=UPI00360F834B